MCMANKKFPSKVDNNDNLVMLNLILKEVSSILHKLKLIKLCPTNNSG